MAVEFLSFNNSEQFRKALVARNLAPYSIQGNFTSPQGLQNYPIKLQDNSPADSESVSSNLYVEPAYSTRMNLYSPAGQFFDGALVVDNTVLPGGGSTENNPLGTSQPYDLQTSRMDLFNEAFIDDAEVVNRYLPPDGYEDLFVTSDLILGKLPAGSQIYGDGKVAPIIFVQGDYTNYEILFGDAALANDSFLQQLAAQSLREATQARIAREIERNTIGAINLDTLTNPFNATLLATGQEPFVYRDYTITKPDGLLDYAAFFIQKLSGTYLPASPIEGSYFSDTEILRLRPLQAIGNLGGGNITNRPNPSIKFLQNTGAGTKSVLFNALNYNRFKPNYAITSTQVGNFINNLFDNFTSIGNLYVGRQETDITNVVSPPNASPIDAFGIPTQAPVYGPDKVGILYEGDQNFQFGLAGLNYEQKPSFDGGFVWITEFTKPEAGRNVGQGGQLLSNNPNFTPLASSYNQVLSTNYTFRPGSILDVTQRLINSTPAQGADRLGHVGNAINQVSKVFSDGYKILTKGSKVKKYVNNSGTEVGQEYCRIFTKDKPYYTYANLQKTVANDSGLETNGNIRRFTYSVLDSTYNLNITPFKNGGTNVINGQVKKYMLSLENLAWKDTPEYNQLPSAEKGPNGGRIMWFPPYDLTFDDSSTPSFNETDFIGRPEPIYTYKNTKRSGSINFKIIVDHPSVLNLIVNKELQNQSNSTITSVVDSFFAGCQRYDIYELAQKFSSLSLGTIDEVYQQVLESLDTSESDKVDALTQIPQEDNSGPKELPNLSSYVGNGIYFNADTTENSNYDQSYENIYNQLVTNINSESFDGIDASKSFLENTITPNYNNFIELAQEIADALVNNNEVKIDLKATNFGVGGISGPESQNLGEDRKQSIIEYFNQLVYQGTNISEYVDSRRLKIDVNSGTIDNYKPKDSSQTYNCNGNNIADEYNVIRVACSTLVISKITVQPYTPFGTKVAKSVSEGYNNTFGLKQVPVADFQSKLKNVTKRLIRELLNEQNYFETIKNSDPFLYDGIKQRIKFFNPLFHSITPEGFNSRITFLNQCVRPGRTIPTTTDNQGGVKNKDAFNTNFGRPPILILRVGDFYNCKIVPDTLSFTYEQLDFNPEGIGVQPAIVNVKLGFKMIGGHGLKEPIEKLQNALSFNFYANTEVYDERADATDDTNVESFILSNQQSSNISQANAAFANSTPSMSNQLNTQITNNGGTQAGNITNSQTSGGVETGTLLYGGLFDNTVVYTQNYFNNIESFVTKIVQTTNYGVYKQVSSEKQFVTGSLNSLDTPVTNVKILGKMVNYNNYLLNVANELSTEITNGTDFLISALIVNNVSTSDIRAVRANYISQVSNQVNNIISKISSQIQSVSNTQVGIYQNYRKLDLICSATDGKITSLGSPYVYTLTGLPDGASDTLTSIRTDYIKLASDVQSYYTLLNSNDIIIDVTTPSTTFTPISSQNIAGNLNRFFTLFCNEIIDNNSRQSLINNLTLNLVSDTVQLTKSIVETTINGLVSSFTVEKNAQTNKVDTFFNSPDYLSYKNYNPQVSNQSIVGKTRNFSYTSAGATPTQNENLKNLYSNVNVNLDKTTFNGKIIFD
jgi:hypothetical protein